MTKQLDNMAYSSWQRKFNQSKYFILIAINYIKKWTKFTGLQIFCIDYVFSCLVINIALNKFKNIVFMYIAPLDTVDDSNEKWFIISLLNIIKYFLKHRSQNEET